MNAPVIFLANGTRGDVQPYIALALGLRSAGVPVRIVTHQRYSDLAVERGLPCQVMEDDPTDLLIRPGGQRALALADSLSGSLRATLAYIREARPLYRRMLSNAYQACQGSRLIIAGLPATWGAHIAEALGVPVVWAFLQPFARTRSHPSALWPFRPPGLTWLNPLTQRLVEQATWQPWRALIDQWRTVELRLPRAPFWGIYDRLYSPQALALYGYSPLVSPPPPDWPSGHVVTGYWFLDPNPGWSPPAGLQEFLEAGEPPVYLGFGSPGTLHPEQTGRLVLDALQVAGLRAVLAMPDMALAGSPLPSWVYPSLDAPHAWLFPRIAAAAHHGGAGTSGAALRAGIPSLALPMAVDQFFWGRRVAELGAGPRPLPRRSLTANALAEHLALAVREPTYRSRARELAAVLSTENGVSRAVERILPMV